MQVHWMGGGEKEGSVLSCFPAVVGATVDLSFLFSTR